MIEVKIIVLLLIILTSIISTYFFLGIRIFNRFAHNGFAF